MLLRDLQALLESLYGIEIEADVRDFLVTDAGALGPIAVRKTSAPLAETLFIEETGSELGLALYLDAGLLGRLENSDPRRCLCGCNLEDFCTVIEGVSHFTYVAWNAARDKRVTLLELEMQAEIDKYLAARALLGRQVGGDIGRDLHPRLFDAPAFDDALPAPDLCRYQDAARLAGGYCRSLESRYPRGAPNAGMLRELRAFFRWPQPAKVSHIHSTILS